MDNSKTDYNTFLFRGEWVEILQDLSENQQRRIYYAVCLYGVKGEVIELRPGSREWIAFNFIKRQIDNAQSRRNIEKDADNSHRRGAPKGNRNAMKAKSSDYSETNKNNSENNSETNKNNSENNSETNKNNSENNSETNKNNSETKTNLDVDDDVDKDNDVDVVDGIVSPPTPTPEDFYLNQEIKALAQDKTWIKAITAKYKIDAKQVNGWLPLFRQECMSNGKKRHENIEDAKSHFNNWLRIQIEHNNHAPVQTAMPDAGNKGNDSSMSGWTYKKPTEEEKETIDQRERQRLLRLIELAKDDKGCYESLLEAFRDGTMKRLAIDWEPAEAVGAGVFNPAPQA